MSNASSHKIEDVVAEYYQALERCDIERVVNMMTSDIVGEMPYSPGDFPKVLRGIPAHRHHFASGMDGYKQIRFVDFRFWPMKDEEHVGLQCRGEFILNNGSRYENNYFCIYRVVGGKVAWWIEYYNPQIFIDAHGSAEIACQHYGVGPAA